MACLSARPVRASLHNNSRAVRSRVRRLKVTASFQNPYAALGLSATADADQIKKAYRKKALEWHPDVSKQEGSEKVFLQLTEAYEFLIGKLRGGDATESSTTDWDWHDWYWSFRINRTWKKQQEGAEPAQPKPAAAPISNIREQLAGLRQRAAIRATKARNSQFAESSRSSIDDEECELEEEAASYTAAAAATPAATSQDVQTTWTATGDSSLQQHDTFAFIDHPGAYRAGVERSSSAQETQRADQQQQNDDRQGSSNFQGAQRRKFVAHSETRDAVRQQLAGLRRKATIVSKAAPAPAEQP